jgi:two-component system, cell cycle sensor histidine kinase and response regulator CckA
MPDASTEDNRRVLVIDDNRAIHEDFRKILAPGAGAASELDASESALFGSPSDRVQQTRFEVDSAYQGQEGALMLKAALERGRPYAMAFVDIRMPPGWDGVETALKLWELDPDLQVVLCTAYSDYSWGEMFDRLGYRDGLLILKKPFDAVEALQLAHALTEKWRLHRESQRALSELEGAVAARTSELRRTNAALESEVIDHERAEKTLRESEERFSGAFEHAPIGVALVSPEGRWLKVNRVVCELLGYSETELLTRGFQEITHPEDLALDMENLRRLLAGDIRSYQREKRYVHRSGQLVAALLNVSLVRDDRGQPSYFISQIQDISERKRLEAQVFQSQKMETVGKMAGGIAHEFNSILTAIIGQSDLLLERLPAGSALIKNATEIGRAADRAAALTRQLLAYGRRQFLQMEPLDLNAVLASMEDMLRHLMGSHVEARVVPAAGLHAVRADAGQMQQVIMNMAINARDAMPHGGKLTFETANVSSDDGSAGAHSELEPGDYVLLAVTDTGVGMGEEIRAHVFEPFFTTKGVGEGTGLGLSTCDGIVRQCGGHITVSSAPGRGTTFNIYLPLVAREASAPAHALDLPDLPRGTQTILLVEPDSALREMAATLLRRLGYSVLAAADGVAALSLQDGHAGHLDLLLTDTVLPYMSGRELSERLAATDPSTRVLFTSARAENPGARRETSGTRVALLQKPFTPTALASKVREVLDEEPMPAVVPGVAKG